VPIYEYVCADCGEKTEVIQRVGERPIRLCPHCGGKVKKKVSAPAIQFKGSGWYVTDYARAKKEGKEGKKAGSEKSESTDKPAEKKEAKESKDKKPAKD
jgi:putative FmdB family regulatory protein